MFRYTNYKNTFVLAAMIILLCFVCLSGATLALFTSNPEDGTIGVITTAGDVEVDIVDAVDENKSLQGEALNFLTTAENQEILFEPGAVFCTEGFKVKNTGTIPINYRLTISADEQKFFDAFDVWVTTDLTDWSSAPDIQQINERLEPGESNNGVFYLVVKMKESISGEEFQDQTYTGIGVTVCAVQGNVYFEE